jgi:hypothetical protein
MTMGETRMHVWLAAERWNTAYRYDTATGKGAKVSFTHSVGSLAGNAGPLAGRLVAIYVDHEARIILQVGSERYPLDGETLVETREIALGLVTRMSVSRPGAPSVTLRCWTPLRPAARLLDPTRDGINEFLDDRPQGIANLAVDGTAQDTYRRIHDHSAAPQA